jgi:hypothetical protein
MHYIVNVMMNVELGELQVLKNLNWHWRGDAIELSSM